MLLNTINVIFGLAAMSIRQAVCSKIIEPGRRCRICIWVIIVASYRGTISRQGTDRNNDARLMLVRNIRENTRGDPDHRN